MYVSHPTPPQHPEVAKLVGRDAWFSVLWTMCRPKLYGTLVPKVLLFFGIWMLRPCPQLRVVKWMNCLIIKDLICKQLLVLKSHTKDGLKFLSNLWPQMANMVCQYPSCFQRIMLLPDKMLSKKLCKILSVIIQTGMKRHLSMPWAQAFQMQESLD